MLILRQWRHLKGASGTGLTNCLTTQIGQYDSKLNSQENSIKHRCMATSVGAADPKGVLQINGQTYPTDDWTNVTPKILSYLGANKHVQRNHPLSILRQRIVNYFYAAYRNSRGNPLFSVYDQLSPIVTVEQNFDNLLFPTDHVSRARSDCYYINRHQLLRAHTTAHQADLIACGLDNFLVAGEVYRRDEIDSTHYPVFHQLDAVRLLTKETLFGRNQDLEIFENDWQLKSKTSAIPETSSKCLDQTKQVCHTLEAVKLMEHEMKDVLVGLARDLFGTQLEYRWVDTYFPFTQPSWELEVLLRVIGWKCLAVASCDMKFYKERLAMVLFDIPDIRLFWSNDSGFLNQFSEENLQKLSKYKPISVYPQCTNDLSFWLPLGVEVDAGFACNDFYDLVRTVAGDVVEQISLIDRFKNRKTGKSSLCFRIVYRHMERTLTQAEVNDIHKRIADACVENFRVEIR
ncbi:unnamed protein product [Ceratitis capitata]|uniref:phenylalanine--tRNA ligase n=1 Tax=Ceratitis capitata TaxID=7213 RepID=A0A811V9S3_CERCA|nr:unnamed protein product [Ceratitis capitata]